MMATTGIFAKNAAGCSRVPPRRSDVSFPTRHMLVVSVLLLALLHNDSCEAFTAATTTSPKTMLLSLPMRSSRPPRPIAAIGIRNPPTRLYRSKKDNDDDDDSNWTDRFNDWKAHVSFQLQKSTLGKKQLPSLPSWWKSVVLGMSTFVMGAIFMLGALLYPLQNLDLSKQPLVQPVTLFETILSDLQTSYVDPVDTTQLFETGMQAMLASLDPYTEFESQEQAVELNESIQGKYGGVGLVISGSSSKNNKAAAAAGEEQGATPKSTMKKKKMNPNGIHVVSAMEGYAFDYGMRVGDRLVAVDDWDIDDDVTTVEDVRRRLRGEPGTTVKISFQRQGLKDVQTIEMPRTIVQLHDVKHITLLGQDQRVGYIQLSGFSANAGREVRNALWRLEQRHLELHNTPTMSGLILDLRGNPGGLLTSAVDVASMLVPKDSDIVSAQGRGFPGLLYKSRLDPLVNAADTKLAVLINGGTASAAEIVSGAVQDLDVGIIVGSDRTFGKGLVQNVEDLPFNTALKYTVAKYYTPSGRCIQGVNYNAQPKNSELVAASQGEPGNDEAPVSMRRGKGGRVIPEQERQVFYTKAGRVVRDGGGIEADYKVQASKASALEVTLLRSGAINDYAAEWSRTHTSDDDVLSLIHQTTLNDRIYKDFQRFVTQRQMQGDLQLEALYMTPIRELQEALTQSGYSTKSLDMLQSDIAQQMQDDFQRNAKELKEDIMQSILARYLPESKLIDRGVRADPQVDAALQLVSDGTQFDTLLASGRVDPQDRPQLLAEDGSSSSSSNTASVPVESEGNLARTGQEAKSSIKKADQTGEAVEGARLFQVNW